MTPHLKDILRPRINMSCYVPTYFPTHYSYPNVPWYPVTPPPYLQPYDPTRGRYGTAEVTIKGYGRQNHCQWGYYPARVGDQGVCCNLLGECGSGDTPLIR